MKVNTDIYTGVQLCAHPSCHWEVDEGHSGIEARYVNERGEPACYSHRDPALDSEGDD